MALAALALALPVPVAAAADRPFAADSNLNTPLEPDAPIDPRSDTMVRELVHEVNRRGAALNHDCWSTPVWTVKRRQRKVRVLVRRDHPRLAQQFARVPLPKRASAACGEDAQLTVLQPSTDTLWEFFAFERDAAGRPTAWYGGRMPNVSTNPGYFTDDPGRRFGATATSIPLLAGLQRLEEIRTGVIDHAVAFAMHSPAPCYRWPAQRQDGDRRGRSDTLAPPQGARRGPAGAATGSCAAPCRG